MLEPSPRIIKRLRECSLEEVTVGIRPEHVLRVGETSGLYLVVEATETLGSYKLLVGNVSGTPFVAEVEAHNTSHPGDVVKVQADPGKLHVFDPATELAI